MFMAALSVTAKYWKQIKTPLTQMSYIMGE